MKTRIIVVGGGGHAGVVIDLLQACGVLAEGFTDPNPRNDHIGQVKHLGPDAMIRRYDPATTELVNGIGYSVHVPGLRQHIYDRYHAEGYRFRTIIHPFAWVSEQAQLADGVQVMAGAIVQNGAMISCNTIINTRASIDHDCCIGEHVHVAPGAVVCGSVRLGYGTFIGAGATVLPGLEIGEHCVIGAGAVVTTDVPDGMKVIGVPAKEA